MYMGPVTHHTATAQSCIHTNYCDEKCDCVTQYFDYSVTG